MMKPTVLWILMFLTLEGGAQEKTPEKAPGITFDLAQARTLALAHSPSLKKANLGINLGQLTEEAQLFSFFPTATASVHGDQSYTNGMSSHLTETVQVTVSQTLWDGGKNQALLAIDKLSTQQARESARETYYSVLDAVDAAYFSLLEAEANLEAAGADLDAAQKALDLAQAKLELGNLTKSDYLQAEATWEAKKTTVSQDQRALAAARGKLSSLVGEKKDGPLAQVDFTRYQALISHLATLDGPGLERVEGQIKASAFQANPALAQKKLSSQMAQLSVDKASAGYFPTLSLSWSNSLTHDPTQADSPLTGTLTLGASLPLSFWNNQTSVESARVAWAQAQEDTNEESRTLELSVETALLDCLSQARSVLSSQKAWDYAQAHYELVWEKYQLANVSLTDLSDASALVSTNRQALITAQYGLLSSFSTLRSLGAFASDLDLEKILSAP